MGGAQIPRKRASQNTSPEIGGGGAHDEAEAEAGANSAAADAEADDLPEKPQGKEIQWGRGAKTPLLPAILEAIVCVARDDASFSCRFGYPDDGFARTRDGTVTTQGRFLEAAAEVSR